MQTGPVDALHCAEHHMHALGERVRPGKHPNPPGACLRKPGLVDNGRIAPTIASIPADMRAMRKASTVPCAPLRWLPQLEGWHF
jgi:hypothetical protein